MYAVIETGGKQYRVQPGSIIKVEKIEANVGDEVVFDKVLAVKKDDGELLIGRPYLDDWLVKAEVLEQGKNKKVYAFRYRPKKRVHILRGHRQRFTRIKVTGIEEKVAEGAASQE